MIHRSTSDVRRPPRCWFHALTSPRRVPRAERSGSEAPDSATDSNSQPIKSGCARSSSRCHPIRSLRSRSSRPSHCPGRAGGGSVPYEPIVPLQQLRAAMTMIIRRPRRSVQLDVEAAIELIAEQRPLDQLPRLIEQTVDGGVMIIADIGPEMLPYLDDVSHLVQAAEQVVGARRPPCCGSRTARPDRRWSPSGRS